MSRTVSRTIVTTGLGFGAFLGVFLVAGVYAVVEYLPPFFGFLIPVGSLLALGVALWPTRFDTDRAAGWTRRLVQRLAAITVAAVVAAALSATSILVFPGFVDWSEAQHRAGLVRRQVPEAEISTILAGHRLTAAHQFRDGLFFTTMPGILVTIVTTIAGSVMFRRRYESAAPNRVRP